MDPGPPFWPRPIPAGTLGTLLVVQPAISASGTMKDAAASLRILIATRRISLPGPVLCCVLCHRFLGLTQFCATVWA
jgi:hypothetical protein